MNAKAVLAVLLCYVLFTAQTYAIQGGPGGGGGFNSLNVVGTYSGVFTGTQEKDPFTGITTASNSIALFTMNVPQTGLATGASLVFSGGNVYNGTLSAGVDPESGTVRGIVNATYSFNISVRTGVTSDGVAIFSIFRVTSTALGKMNANILASNNFRTFTGSTTPATLVTARLTGTAELDTNFGGINGDFSPVINRLTRYTIDGFKQQASSSSLGTASQ